jgi:hypothetical protein
MGSLHGWTCSVRSCVSHPGLRMPPPLEGARAVVSPHPATLQPVIPGLTGNLAQPGQLGALDPRFHGDDEEEAGMTMGGTRGGRMGGTRGGQSEEAALG